MTATELVAVVPVVLKQKLLLDVIIGEIPSTTLVPCKKVLGTHAVIVLSSQTLTVPIGGGAP